MASISQMKQWHPFRLVLTFVVLVQCGCAPDTQEPSVSTSQAERNGVAFVTDVPNLDESMLNPEYWVQKLRDNQRRMTHAQIETFNRHSFEVDSDLFDLTEWPDALARDNVLALIDRVSKAASSPRYFVDGNRVTDQDYQRWQAALALNAVDPWVTVRWGLVVARAHMRSFPTTERIVKQRDDLDLDRLQETGVFPGQRVALVHESADGLWWFAVNYHYAAWLPKWAVAEASRAQVEAFQTAPAQLLVTGASAKTNFNPIDSRTSEIQLDMGVRLPMLSAREVGHNVQGQNPYASFIVQLPVRDSEGRLALVPTLIARSQPVVPGTLPFTDANVIRQAFKFLGERYGWGHDYNARDCTGFVGEIYKTFGFLMPRNSGQQGASSFAPTLDLRGADRATRWAALQQLNVGDLIYIPGHVMIFIGREDDQPYVIHDVTGLSYLSEEQQLYRGVLSGVSVTPLLPLRLSADKDFVDSIYAIKSIR